MVILTPRPNPGSMISFPNAKINLGLNIIQKRADGYHDIETIFYPVNLKDALEFVPANELAFTSTGLSVDGAPENNLCFKAYHLLKKDFPNLSPLQIHLHKAIFMGAGLGGGSADGAFMLQMLNEHFQLGLTEETLINYALQLGSDCPFFILNKPVYATGRGEMMNRIKLDLSTFTFVLVNPGIHISTAAAFASVQPANPVKSVSQIVHQPIATWKEDLVNDFEKTVFKLYPEMEEIKRTLYTLGALYASMSGSGSTVYGIFPESFVGEFQFPKNYSLAILPKTDA